MKEVIEHGYEHMSGGGSRGDRGVSRVATAGAQRRARRAPARAARSRSSPLDGRSRTAPARLVALAHPRLRRRAAPASSGHRAQHGAASTRTTRPRAEAANNARTAQATRAAPSSGPAASHACANALPATSAASTAASSASIRSVVSVPWRGGRDRRRASGGPLGILVARDGRQHRQTSWVDATTRSAGAKSKRAASHCAGSIAASASGRARARSRLRSPPRSAPARAPRSRRARRADAVARRRTRSWRMNGANAAPSATKSGSRGGCRLEIGRRERGEIARREHARERGEVHRERATQARRIGVAVDAHAARSAHRARVVEQRRELRVARVIEAGGLVDQPREEGALERAATAAAAPGAAGRAPRRADAAAIRARRAGVASRACAASATSAANAGRSSSRSMITPACGKRRAATS